jgi:hypothetical protein
MNKRKNLFGWLVGSSSSFFSPLRLILVLWNMKNWERFFVSLLTNVFQWVSQYESDYIYVLGND